VPSTRWLILLVLFLARAAMSFQFQTIGAVGPLLIDRLHIDFTWLGTLIGLYMLPGAVVALPSGVLGQRFGAKQIVLVSLALMAIGGAATASDQLAFAVAGRLVSGIGGIAMSIMLTKMVTDWFAGKEIVTAMSILIASWPLGIGFSFLLFPPLATAWSWQAVMLLAAAFALLCLVLVAAFYRDAPDAPRAADGVFSIKLTKREWILAIVAGAMWGLFNVGFILLVNFAPELFVRAGYSAESAGAIVSLLGWGTIPLVPLAGFAVERVKRPDLFMAVGFVLGGALALALPFAGAPVAVLLCLVITTSLPAGPIFSLLAPVLSPQNRAVGMGVFFTLFYLGMASLPALAGKFRDVTGEPAAPIVFASAMMASGVVLLLAFRTAQRLLKQA
jgi:predicted MFS family arabinose efflux permease